MKYCIQLALSGNFLTKYIKLIFTKLLKMLSLQIFILFIYRSPVYHGNSGQIFVWTYFLPSFPDPFF